MTAVINSESEPGTFDYAFRNKKWASTDNKVSKIKDLKINHFVNILNWIATHPHSYNDDVKAGMVNEAKHRAFLAFTNGESAPVQDEDGVWKLKSPKTGKLVNARKFKPSK